MSYELTVTLRFEHEPDVPELEVWLEGGLAEPGDYPVVVDWDMEEV